MKFFEVIPSELFSPLASPNRVLYADALEVLYLVYRDNLKIPEDTLYSVLRSNLEQQLADAAFEGEDIDEDELRDISGRARFLIRKLCSKGWVEKERGEDFQEYITVPGYSSRLLELFHQLRDDSPVRGYSFVLRFEQKSQEPVSLSRLLWNESNNRLFRSLGGEGMPLHIHRESIYTGLLLSDKLDGANSLLK